MNPLQTYWLGNCHDLVPVDHLLYNLKPQETEQDQQFSRECVGSMVATLMILSPMLWHICTTAV